MSDTPPTARDRAIAAEELRYAVRTGDVLSIMEREVMGNGNRRLDVPLRDPVDLRRIATIFRSLANNLELCSHMRGPAKHALYAASSHLREAAGQLRSKPTRNNR